MPSDYWREQRRRRQEARRGLYTCLCSRKLYPEQQTCPTCGRRNPQATEEPDPDA